MAFKIGKILGSVIGAPLKVAGGLLGLNEGKAARNAINEQKAAYESQANAVRQQQNKINENLQRSIAARNVGVARANRSRIRGGGFGESAGNNNVSPRLGGS